MAAAQESWEQNLDSERNWMGMDSPGGISLEEQFRQFSHEETDQHERGS